MEFVTPTVSVSSDAWFRSAYVSSRFGNRDIVRAFSLKLATLSIPFHCIQTWTECGDVTPDRSETCLAERDLFEIDSAPNFIQLTQHCEVSRGGMHVELGYALARGKRIVIVGPRVTIFHHMPNFLWFPSIPEYIGYLTECVRA